MEYISCAELLEKAMEWDMEYIYIYVISAVTIHATKWHNTPWLTLGRSTRPLRSSWAPLWLPGTQHCRIWSLQWTMESPRATSWARVPSDEIRATFFWGIMARSVSFMGCSLFAKNLWQMGLIKTVCLRFLGIISIIRCCFFRLYTSPFLILQMGSRCQMRYRSITSKSWRCFSTRLARDALRGRLTVHFECLGSCGDALRGLFWWRGCRMASVDEMEV